VYVRVTSSTIVEVAALRATVGQLLSGRERVLVRAIAPMEPPSVVERALGIKGPVVARAVFLRVEAPGPAKPRPQSGSRRWGRHGVRAGRDGQQGSVELPEGNGDGSARAWFRSADPYQVEHRLRHAERQGLRAFGNHNILW
jgi:hypothetical protein